MLWQGPVKHPAAVSALVVLVKLKAQNLLETTFHLLPHTSCYLNPLTICISSPVAFPSHANYNLIAKSA